MADSLGQTLPQVVEAYGNVFSRYGPLMSVVAILLSALIAGSIALKNIKEQRGIARRRATLDLISNREWDGDYIHARKEFNKLKVAQPTLEFWAGNDHKDSPQLNVIRAILNDYELIAIGMKEGILDEPLYKLWFKSSLVNDYKKAAKAIDAIRERTGVPTIYIEFERLAKRWQGESP